MTEDSQKRFEEAFEGAVQTAVQSKLHRLKAPAELAENLTASLARAAAEEPAAAPPPIQRLERFEDALRRAVQKSAARPLAEAHRQQLEAAVRARLSGSPAPEWQVREQLDSPVVQLHGKPVLAEQRRWIESFDRSVGRALGSRTAPAELRTALLAKIVAGFENTPQTPIGPLPPLPPLPKVVPLPSRSLWKQALTAAASIAAVFGLLVGTFLTSADSALANSVQRDHQRCGQRMARAEAAPDVNLTSERYERIVERFGSPPELKLDDDWTLHAMKVCRRSDGRSMIHKVYTSYDHDGNRHVLSCHLIPPYDSEAELVRAVLDRGAEPPQLRTLADGELPVLAGEIAGWTYTICTSDLDRRTLAEQLAATAP